MTRARITGTRIQHIELRELRLVSKDGIDDSADSSDTLGADENHERGGTLEDGALTRLKAFFSEQIVSLKFRLGYRAYWAGRFDKANAWLRPLAERHSDCAAQYYIGRMHARGEGVDQDMSEALRWWNASAGRGERWAQVEIGNLYELGQGVPADLNKAFRWYQRAADAGLAEAQVRVGYFYDNGLGDVALNHLTARQWYLRAAVQGERNAYHNLAVHYARGLGMPADKQKAIAWLNEARPHESNGDIERQAEIW